MPNVPAAAAQASQSDSCAHCGKRLNGPLSPHVCAECGVPQPLAGEDFFVALGVPRRFEQNVEQLTQRFYELSRALHPDRFSGAGADALRASLERMSFLNQAYTALKNPTDRREYLLTLEGVSVPKDTKTQMPMELAEAWFELQDIMTEEPVRAGAKSEQFEKDLKAALLLEEKEIGALEKSFDESRARGELQEIAKRIQTQSYLKSLERDVARIRARFGK